MDIGKLNAIQWAKIAAAAAVAGGVLGAILPAATVGSIDHWGGPIMMALAGLVGVGTAFLAALRRK